MNEFVLALLCVQSVLLYLQLRRAEKHRMIAVHFATLALLSAKKEATLIVDEQYPGGIRPLFKQESHL